MNKLRLHTVFIALAALCAASSPLVAASCQNSGNWRKTGGLFDASLRARVSANALDPADGWKVTGVQFFTRLEGGSYGDAITTKEDVVQLDGKRQQLWQDEIVLYENDGSSKATTNRVRIEFENAAGLSVVCAVHFEGRSISMPSKDEARFSSATCGDENGNAVAIDNEKHPYASCERTFVNGDNRFNVVLRLKDQ